MQYAPQSIFDNSAKLIKKTVADSVRELESTPRHMLDPSNPNHPDYDLKLFGYDAGDFMAMQYKQGR